MSSDFFDKPALIRHRLQQAKETLADAQVLYAQGRTPVSIVNRAYYAMFYATLALLVTVDKDSSKHSGVIALFDKHFVKQNLVPKEMSKMLHDAFESRQEGDYRDMSKIDHAKATEILRSAEIYIHSIKEKLSNQL